MKKRSSIMKDISMLQDDRVNASITTVANDSLTTIKGKVTDISQGKSSGILNIPEMVRRFSTYEYTLTYDKDKKIITINSLEDKDEAALGLTIDSIYGCGPFGCNNDDINVYVTLEIGIDTFKLMFPKNNTAYISFKIIKE